MAGPETSAVVAIELAVLAEASAVLVEASAVAERAVTSVVLAVVGNLRMDHQGSSFACTYLFFKPLLGWPSLEDSFGLFGHVG